MIYVVRRRRRGESEALRGASARGAASFEARLVLLTKSLRSAAEWQSDVARATKGV